jgi:hypothetical protein
MDAKRSSSVRSGRWTRFPRLDVPGLRSVVDAGNRCVEPGGRLDRVVVVVVVVVVFGR